MRVAANFQIVISMTRFLPDKALDVVDEAGANHTLLPVNQRPALSMCRSGAIVAKIWSTTKCTQSDKRSCRVLMLGKAECVWSDRD